MTHVLSKSFLDNLHKAEEKSTQALTTPRASSPSAPPVTVQSPGPIPKDGLYIIHNQQGRLIKIDPYVHGKLDGLMQIFDPSTQKIIQETHYKAGEREGISTIYDTSGVILIQTPYKQNKKEGVETVYSKKGDKLSETTYVKGIKSGPFRQFSPHNVLSVEGTYQNNVLEGSRVTYYPSGAILEKAIYHNGHPVKTLTTLYPNGHIQKLETYDDTGKKISVEKYDINGVQVTQKEPVPATH